ncbi:MAG TPA: hypothetical protein VJH96_03975 [Patescibacteria group bacterium]|nr:hypothetical protein [Patescibacteria group bacterium]
MLIRLISRISKRRRLIIATVSLVCIMLYSTFLSFSSIKYVILAVAAATYFFTFFSILEGINKYEWLMLFIAPVMFTVAFNLFYFLLPVRWLTRIPFVALYAISLYALLLSSNIFNVGVVKSLQLFRVAFSVNFLFLTMTAFLICNVILSFRLNFVLNFFLIFIALFPLALQFIWSAKPKVTLDKETVLYSLLIALYVAEVSVVFSFMPLKQAIFALVLTGCFYSLLGLFYSYLDRRLFTERVREFIFVIIFVFIIAFLSLAW